MTAHVGELFYEVKEVNAFDYPDSATVTGNGLSDSVYKTFDNLWKNKGNNDSGQLFLASLGKLTKEKTEFHAKIKQLLASQNVVKNNNEFSSNNDQLQMHVNSLKVSMCVLEERIISPVATDLKL